LIGKESAVQLTALVERVDHVCCRYRLEAYARDLRRAGHHLEIRPWPRRWWQWFRLGQELRGADAVIVQRRLLQAWQLCLVRRAARRLFYDLDDAVFLRDSYSKRGLYSASRLRRFRATVRAADAVLAGNAYLAAEAARWTTTDKVVVVPTCIEPERYTQAEHELSGASANLDAAVQLVWIGTASTLRGLQTIQPLLEQVGQHVPEVRLKLICDRFLEFKHLLVVPCAWTETGEASELAAADIGVSWLPDDAWSRGKCGLKVLQYMAAGLPVVANPVGIHCELIEQGVNGFLASSPEEWIAAIRQLARDPGMRRTMGQAGRRRVARDFSRAVGAKCWLGLLDPSANRSLAA
jgi:glycosyltransferase involved in cell wall biosynthesis